MKPQEEKKQEEKQREVSDAELQKVAGGTVRIAKEVPDRKRKVRLLDVELTGVTGGTGGVVLKKAAKKR